MKKYLSFTLLLFSLIIYSCSKNDELTGGGFNMKEWCTHVDTSSDLIIFIPDIQLYTYKPEYTKCLNDIVEKILTLKDNGFKVKAVVQSGDITDHNTIPEWETAKRIFSKLDGTVPYIMCTGNHDYGDFGHCDSRSTSYNDYFSYSGKPYFISSDKTGRYDNSFFRVQILGQPFLILSLGFGPGDHAISWADSIARANDGETGMILTHAYLYKDNMRFDYESYGSRQNSSPYDYSLAGVEKVNDGQDLWNKLIYPNKLFRFVLCGHMSYPSYVGNLISADSNTNSCLQLLFDPQILENGGNGWIQILEFKNDRKSIKISTYSATTDTWMTGSAFQYLYVYN